MDRNIPIICHTNDEIADYICDYNVDMDEFKKLMMKPTFRYLVYSFCKLYNNRTKKREIENIEMYTFLSCWLPTIFANEIAEDDYEFQNESKRIQKQYPIEW